MDEWTAGYVADIGYTFGYYPDLNPLRVGLAFLNAGLRIPKIKVACELGFGQGVSVNMHAAATITQWVGTDFNPAQASFARELAEASGVNTALYDEAFANFCNRTDLPQFDYIGIHGIWSWISNENRKLIVDFLHRKLKVGGVLYISYNTQPGWAAMVPMRELLIEHVRVMSANGSGIVNNINNALGFVDDLLSTNPKYALANPQIKGRVAKIRTQDRHYLAHEYFNRDWEPMSFAKMADWLEAAKLQWACSANFLDSVERVNLGADQQSLLNNISDPVFRQTVRDFCVNQQFRKDYWVKGARRLSSLEQAEQLRGQRVVLIVPREDVSLKVVGSLGEGQLSEHVCNPILRILADHKPRTISQLEQELKESVDGSGISFTQLLQTILVFCGNGILAVAQDESLAQHVKKQAEKLNRNLLVKARSDGDISVLASPVTGGGVNVTRFQQLFLLARDQGRKEPKEWAQFAWGILAAQGQKIMKNNQALQSEEEHLLYLTELAEKFAEKQLPVLRALKVA